LQSKGIVAVARNAVIGPVMSSSVSLVRIPTILRYTFADIFSRYVSFPFDGVLAGMVVGYQGGLPQSIQDLFRNTGVLHVLVLSGYNITLLAGFLAILLKGLPLRVRSIITVLAIVLIVLVSGAGVASIRAGIMGSIAVFATLSIRTYRPMRALTLSYLVFFFISPTTLFVDPGFHLSFLATLFMIVVLPKVERVFLFIPQTNHVDLRELIMLAVSAPIFMLPYMMYFSGMFPLSSPFANILFALITPVIMVAGIILIALSWITPIATCIGVLLSGFGRGGVLCLFIQSCLDYCLGESLQSFLCIGIQRFGVRPVHSCKEVLYVLLFARGLVVRNV
jgi:competence protein ComEC